jgi:hypothetical protein
MYTVSHIYILRTVTLYRRNVCFIQGDQKFSVPLIITIQKHHYHNTRLSCLTTSLNLTAWQPATRARGGTGLTLTPSVIPNSNHVIMVTNCLKYFCVCIFFNRQVHRDVLITLYVDSARTAQQTLFTSVIQNQSVNAVCGKSRSLFRGSVHNTQMQLEHHVEFFNIKLGGTARLKFGSSFT